MKCIAIWLIVCVMTLGLVSTPAHAEEGLTPDFTKRMERAIKFVSDHTGVSREDLRLYEARWVRPVSESFEVVFGYGEGESAKTILLTEEPEKPGATPKIYDIPSDPEDKEISLSGSLPDFDGAQKKFESFYEKKCETVPEQDKDECRVPYDAVDAVSLRIGENNSPHFIFDYSPPVEPGKYLDVDASLTGKSKEHSDLLAKFIDVITEVDTKAEGLGEDEYSHVMDVLRNVLGDELLEPVGGPLVRIGDRCRSRVSEPELRFSGGTWVKKGSIVICDKNEPRSSLATMRRMTAVRCRAKDKNNKSRLGYVHRLGVSCTSQLTSP